MKRAQVALVPYLLLVTCSVATSPRLRIDAAASLREVVQELAELYASRTGGPLPLVNLAGSGELARQIEAARKTDVFLSAGALEMDRLAERGLLATETRRNLCSNALVVVARDPHSDFQVAQLARAGRLSVAHAELVPAGRYATAWLRNTGLYAALESKLTPAMNVRAALAAVQSGACEFGIVYASDAAVASDLHVVLRIPGNESPPIDYPGAVLIDASNPADASAFLELCASAEGRAIFERHGFLSPRVD